MKVNEIANCCNHFHVLNCYYRQLVNCLRAAGEACEPQDRVGTEKHWWTPESQAAMHSNSTHLA